MIRVPGGLGFRLTALNLLAFGLLQALLGLAMIVAREQIVRHDFDARTITRARELAQAVEAAVVHAGWRPEDERWPDLQSPDLTGLIVRVRLPGGTVVGDWPGNPGPPMAEIMPDPAGPPVVDSVVAPGHDARPVDWRVVTLHRRARDGANYTLQVARDQAPLLESIGRFRRIVGFIVLSGLIATGFASVWVARRSLSPLHRIVGEIDRITPVDIDRRVFSPADGGEVDHLARAFNGMLDRLETAFRAQERFVGDAAHELKTPLAMLAGNLEHLRRDHAVPSETAALLERLRDETHRLARAVDGLLLLARSDGGLTTRSDATVALNDVVVEAAERCADLARQRGVRLRPVLPMPAGDRVEPVVSGDAGLLGVMLENLVRNAVRWAATATDVRIVLAVDGTEAVLSVLDEGPGIPPEHLPRVFERFYTVPGRDGAPTGFGIGLAIAQGVARMHGGSISAANRPEGGCEFVVRLPLATTEFSGP